jgi:hypothetical protein
MGMSADQVGRMSLWQFTACVDGWMAVNSPDKPGEDVLSPEEAAQIARTIDEPAVWENCPWRPISNA